MRHEYEALVHKLRFATLSANAHELCLEAADAIEELIHEQANLLGIERVYLAPPFRGAKRPRLPDDHLGQDAALIAMMLDNLEAEVRRLRSVRGFFSRFRRPSAGSKPVEKIVPGLFPKVR